MIIKCPFPHNDKDPYEKASSHPSDFPCGKGLATMEDEVTIAEAVAWACVKAAESYVDPTKSGKR